MSDGAGGDPIEWPMAVGDRFVLRCRVTAEMHRVFCDVFGDRNPTHVDGDFARAHGFAGPIMHGNILGGFLSRLVGEELPMKEVVIQSQTMHFRKPVYLNDELDLEATVLELIDSVRVAELSFDFRNSSGARVASGTLQLNLPE